MNLESVISGKDRTLVGGLLRGALACLEPGYRVVVRCRNTAFDWGVRRPHQLSKPVVSVGNLTVGGTGKTPMIIELVGRLLAMGRHPAVLLRGYKGAAGLSDEAGVLQDGLGPGVPIEAGADRLAASHRVLEKHPQTDVFLLDDGFQHRQVHRDLDLVLIDATRPFGHGHVLPRGWLREPASSLRRAHAVIVTRCDQVRTKDLRALDRRIARLSGRKPIAHCFHRWVGLKDANDQPVAMEDMGQKRVVGVCGIGNPSAFEKQLQRCCKQVIALLVFADHHRYQPDEIQRSLQQATDQGADAVVTTEKDWVKWRGLIRGLISGMPSPVPIYRVDLRMSFCDGSVDLQRLLRQKLLKNPGKNEKS